MSRPNDQGDLDLHARGPFVFLAEDIQQVMAGEALVSHGAASAAELFMERTLQDQRVFLEGQEHRPDRTEETYVDPA